MKSHVSGKFILTVTAVCLSVIAVADKMVGDAHAALTGINDPNREAYALAGKLDQSFQKIKALEQNLAQSNEMFIKFKALQEQRIEKLEKTISTMDQSNAMFIKYKASQEQRTLILERRLTCIQQALRFQEQLTKIREVAVNCN
jgi:hypothetical protein